MHDIIQENAIESRLINEALLKTNKTIVLHKKYSSLLVNNLLVHL